MRLTSQVQDFLAAAADKGQKVVIVVRHDTRIHKKFDELIASGQVLIIKAAPK